MKIHNPTTYDKLGFSEVIAYVQKRVLSEEGRIALEEIKPTSNRDFLLEELQRVQEFKELLEFDDPFPTQNFTSVSSLLAKTQVEGNWLSREELHRFLKWLYAIRDVRQYLHSRKDKYPKCDALVNGPVFQKNLISAITKIIDAKGYIKDSASPTLASLRKEIKVISSDLRVTLNRVLRKANEKGWSNASEITIRNDRLVIPVKTDFKGNIPGFVQDVSQSGQTVFVEPAAALVLNNRLKEVVIREHNEVINILTAITAHIAEYADELATFREVMISIDLIRAKALLAMKLECNLPIIDENDQKIHIMLGYYPVLLLKALKEKISVVPMDLRMDTNRRIALISGPNAGGKSVALKTLGLLQLMLQCGFLIPVDERSTFRLFTDLYVDLGDEQSVENDLSTYTSHLRHWRIMADSMNAGSLFLIDEFGSGTDPNQGGAIAEAFLERFLRQKAYGIITTHYGNLKDFAEISKGIENAAMEFDKKNLKPTYHLVDGMPGRSYAFEIAERVGVHHTVIGKARKKVGKKQLNTDKLLKKLEDRNLEMNRLVESNKHKQARLDHLTNKYEKLNHELKVKRQKLIREAQLEAKRVIEEANKRIERTIREIKEHAAEKTVTKKLRQELKASAPKVIPNPEPEQKNKGFEVVKDAKIEAGDWVKFKTSNSFGEVTEVKGKNVFVLMNEMKVRVKLNQLIKIRKPEQKESVTSSRKQAGGFNLLSVKSEIDVRGMRVDEVMPILQKHLDEAMMAGIQEFRILHGKGNGVLREFIRKFLNDLDYIESYRDAPIDLGGSGWTYIRLKK